MITASDLREKQEAMYDLTLVQEVLEEALIKTEQLLLTAILADQEQCVISITANNTNPFSIRNCDLRLSHCVVNEYGSFEQFTEHYIHNLTELGYTIIIHDPLSLLDQFIENEYGEHNTETYWTEREYTRSITITIKWK